MSKSKKRMLEINNMLKSANVSFGDDSIEDVLKNLKNMKHHEHKSYMAKPQLYAIAKMAAELHELLEDGEPIDDWAESHIAKCEQMLQSVYNKITYKKTYRGESYDEE